MADNNIYLNIYEPTYRKEPVEDERFYPSQAKAIAQAALEETLTNQDYDEDDAKEWSNTISDKTRDNIQKDLKLPRYKIIVQTSIGQLKDQGIRVASRCLWDVNTDNYASASFINKTLFANVMVFAVYCD
jgi:hypothetical protein